MICTQKLLLGHRESSAGKGEYAENRRCSFQFGDIS